MGYQTAPHSSLGLPGDLFQFMTLTEGTALPFEFEWVLYPAFGSPPALTAHPIPLPPPIESIRDITGTEKKTASKTSSFKIASRISYEMIAI